VNVAPSSHMLCSRVRNLSVAFLTRLRARPSLRTTALRRPLRGHPHPSTPSSRSSEHTHRWAARPHRRDASCLDHLAAVSQAHFAFTGPYDAYQCMLARPPRAVLRQLADRSGLPLPTLLVACICQPCFRLDRPWAPTLQRFLPARAVPSHQPAETGFPRPRTILPAVPHRPPTACLATDCLRCDAAAPRIQARLLTTGLAARPGYPNGCVLRRRRCSRPRRVAPLLVVTPLRG
jgi:hypothetical protein